MAPLEAAVSRAFPERSVAAIEPQNSRPGNEVGRVTFSDGDVGYVKTATDTDRRLVREIAATRYAAANCPIEVPDVLGFDTDDTPPYLAMASLPGIPLNDPWTNGRGRAPLLRQAGRTLAGIHQARFESPGRIVGGDEDGLELTEETWTDALCETVRWRAEDWFAERFSDVPDRLVETLRDADPVLEGADARLLHADCSRINVHLDPNGVLDWERALVGDPAFDLVDAYGHLVDQVDVDEADRPALKAALYDGYRERAGELPAGLERREPIYHAVAHALVPQTFEDWAPPLETSDDELAARVRAEFESRLDEARHVIA